MLFQNSNTSLIILGKDVLILKLSVQQKGNVDDTSDDIEVRLLSLVISPPQNPCHIPITSRLFSDELLPGDINNRQCSTQTNDPPIYSKTQHPFVFPHQISPDTSLLQHLCSYTYGGCRAVIPTRIHNERNTNFLST